MEDYESETKEFSSFNERAKHEAQLKDLLTCVLACVVFSKFGHKQSLFCYSSQGEEKVQYYCTLHISKVK